MIETIAKFMGWKRWEDDKTGEFGWLEDRINHRGKKVTEWHSSFNPLEDWNDWMMVEAKLRERGLWWSYCYEIKQAMDAEFKPYDAVWEHYMLATLEQRMEAAVNVIKGVSDEGS